MNEPERKEVVLAEEEQPQPQRVSLGTDPEKFANQMVRINQAMRTLAVAVTAPNHWVNMGDGDEPYLTKKGCEVFCNKFGISTRVIDYKKEIYDDADGEYWIFEYRVLAKVRHPLTGDIMEAERTGTRSTKDKFFGWRNGRRLPISEVDTTNVKKAAETNAMNRAIKAILGFHPTWEELQNAFGDRAKTVGKVQYDQSATRAAGKGVITDTKKELWRLISEMAYGKEEAARDLLAEYSAFPVNKGPDKGKIVPGVRSVKDLSDRRAEVTLHKVRPEYEEWKRVEDEAAQEGGDA